MPDIKILEEELNRLKGLGDPVLTDPLYPQKVLAVDNLVVAVCNTCSEIFKKYRSIINDINDNIPKFTVQRQRQLKDAELLFLELEISLTIVNTYVGLKTGREYNILYGITSLLEVLKECQLANDNLSKFL